MSFISLGYFYVYIVTQMQHEGGDVITYRIIIINDNEWQWGKRIEEFANIHE